MFEADPDFAMGHIYILGLECFATNPENNDEPRKKLIDFSKRKTQIQLTNLEKKHMEAAELLAMEDNIGAMLQFENILKWYPEDMHALHMAFHLALATGQTKRLLDTPASVVKHYTILWKHPW